MFIYISYTFIVTFIDNVNFIDDYFILVKSTIN